MTSLLVGYARVSTDQQDLTSQREGLAALGVAPNRIYVDHGLTGTNRERPGLREALAACREGDTLVVTKLDRLARSLPDARAIADELTVRQVSLNLGGSVYDPTDPVGRLLFNVLAMVAEFESDLIRLRTRELADLFSVARSTVYRAVERERALRASAPQPPAKRT
jgi:DNA invertase Pin-like site-specific DNA recombinase